MRKKMPPVAKLLAAFVLYASVCSIGRPLAAGYQIRGTAQDPYCIDPEAGLLLTGPKKGEDAWT